MGLGGILLKGEGLGVWRGLEGVWRGLESVGRGLQEDCQPDLDNKSAGMTPLILEYKPMALGGLPLLTGISRPTPHGSCRKDLENLVSF